MCRSWGRTLGGFSPKTVDATHSWVRTLASVNRYAGDRCGQRDRFQSCVGVNLRTAYWPNRESERVAADPPVAFRSSSMASTQLRMWFQLKRVGTTNQNPLQCKGFCASWGEISRQVFHAGDTPGSQEERVVFCGLTSQHPYVQCTYMRVECI